MILILSNDIFAFPSEHDFDAVFGNPALISLKLFVLILLVIFSLF